jgi:ArsR family transcriptional regulator, lead/cadmium/zinc/bismuth-responsive transcriptional repressor
VAFKRTQVVEEDECPVRIIHPDKVAKARSEAMSEQDVGRIVQTYKALSDPTRLQILLALRRQEMCVCDLAAFLGISESAVSHQMRRLRDLALVKSRREGQVLYYVFNDHHIGDLIRLSLQHIGLKKMRE